MIKDEKIQGHTPRNERYYRIDNVNVCVRSSFNGHKDLNDILFSITNDKLQEIM